MTDTKGLSPITSIKQLRHKCEYLGVDPFTPTTPLTLQGYVQMWLTTCLLLPLFLVLYRCGYIPFYLAPLFLIPVLRILATILLFFLMYPVGCLLEVFNSLTGIIRPSYISACRLIIRCLTRAIQFAWSFHYIHIQDDRGPLQLDKPPPRVIVSNHIGVADSMGIFSHYDSLGVAKSDYWSYPILGKVLKGANFIPVDRSTPQTREEAKRVIKAAISDKDNPPVLVFPEGTCSIPGILTQFMTGAFLTDQPIQPILLRYPSPAGHFLAPYDQAFVGGADLPILWRTWCQPLSKQSLQLLPIYYPTEEEKHDPKLLANNVRAVMARALGATCTNHTYNDVRLRIALAGSSSSSAQLPALNFTIEEVLHSTSLTWEEMKGVVLPVWHRLMLLSPAGSSQPRRVPSTSLSSAIFRHCFRTHHSFIEEVFQIFSPPTQATTTTTTTSRSHSATSLTELLFHPPGWSQSQEAECKIGETGCMDLLGFLLFAGTLLKPRQCRVTEMDVIASSIAVAAESLPTRQLHLQMAVAERNYMEVFDIDPHLFVPVPVLVPIPAPQL